MAYPNDADLVESVDLGSNWIADDGTLVTETLAYDGDTATIFAKIGKNPEDGVKVTWNTGIASLAVGDIFKIWVMGSHNFTDMALLAYLDSNSANATGKIVVTVSTGQFNDFTVTQAFIDQLGDQGSGKFSIRFVPDLNGTGDASCSELDQSLTAAGGATPQALVATSIGVATMGLVITYARTLAVTTAPAAILTPVSTFLRTLAATTLPTAVLNKKMFVPLVVTTAPTALLATAKFFTRVLAATATGVAALTTVPTFARTLAATAVGVAVLTRVATYTRTLAAISVGVPVILKKMFVTMSATTVGTATLIAASLVQQTMVATAIGVAALTTQITRAVVMAATAVGVAVLNKKMFVTMSATAVGVATLVTSKTIRQALVATATGVAVMTESFVGVVVIAATTAVVAIIGTLFIPGAPGPTTGGGWITNIAGRFTRPIDKT